MLFKLVKNNSVWQEHRKKHTICSEQLLRTSPVKHEAYVGHMFLQCLSYGRLETKSIFHHEKKVLILLEKRFSRSDG